MSSSTKRATLFLLVPSSLPKIFLQSTLDFSPFGMPSIDPDRPTAQWNTPLRGKYLSLALEILNIVTEPKVADLFSVKRIDVSNAFTESYGTREIVVITEDFLIRSINGKEVQFCLPRILRLSTKYYAQELGNYLKLREQTIRRREEDRDFT